MDPVEDPGDLEEVEDYGEDGQETLENPSKKLKLVKHIVSEMRFKRHSFLGMRCLERGGGHHRTWT